MNELKTNFGPALLPVRLLDWLCRQRFKSDVVVVL